jgi:hypothetical protein
MPPILTDKVLTDAVFSSVDDGTYPENEKVISAELPTSALNNLSELLEQARIDVKVLPML